jgi:hypothetical protein
MGENSLGAGSKKRRRGVRTDAGADDSTADMCGARRTTPVGTWPPRLFRKCHAAQQGVSPLPIKREVETRK